MTNEKQQVTLYIANRAFGGLRKFSSYLKHRQIFNLAFKMNNIKIWLSANLKVYRFPMPYLPNTNRYVQ